HQPLADLLGHRWRQVIDAGRVEYRQLALGDHRAERVADLCLHHAPHMIFSIFRRGGSGVFSVRPPSFASTPFRHSWSVSSFFLAWSAASRSSSWRRISSATDVGSLSWVRSCSAAAPCALPSPLPSTSRILSSLPSTVSCRAASSAVVGPLVSVSVVPVSSAIGGPLRVLPVPQVLADAVAGVEQRE